MLHAVPSGSFYIEEKKRDEQNAGGEGQHHESAVVVGSRPSPHTRLRFQVTCTSLDQTQTLYKTKLDHREEKTNKRPDTEPRCAHCVPVPHVVTRTTAIPCPFSVCFVPFFSLYVYVCVCVCVFLSYCRRGWMVPPTCVMSV